MNTDDIITLFYNNVPLAYHICNKCFDKLPSLFVNNNKDDLEQQALLGLWSACEKYDCESTTKFSTYAGIAIERSILNYAEKHLRWRRGSDNPTIVSIHDETSGGLTIEDSIPMEEKIDVTWIFTDDRLNELQKKVCKLKYERYTDEEIGDILGFSKCYANKILKQVGKILND